MPTLSHRRSTFLCATTTHLLAPPTQSNHQLTLHWHERIVCQHRLWAAFLCHCTFNSRSICGRPAYICGFFLCQWELGHQAYICGFAEPERHHNVSLCLLPRTGDLWVVQQNSGQNFCAVLYKRPACSSGNVFVKPSISCACLVTSIFLLKWQGRRIHMLFWCQFSISIPFCWCAEGSRSNSARFSVRYPCHHVLLVA